MIAKDIVTLLRGIGVASSCIKQSEEWVSAQCPFAPYTHSKGTDRSASFGVAIQSEGYSGFNCLSCGEHGSLRTMLETLEDYTGNDYSKLVEFVDSAETPVAYLPWEERVERQRELPNPLDQEAFDEVFSPAIDYREAVRYFQARHLDPDTMEKLDLRFDESRHRILFKAMRDGELYGVSGRSTLDSATNKVRVYNYPKSLFLLNEENIQFDNLSRPVIVVEGLMALPELYSLGIEEWADPVALQGSKMSIAQRDRLVEFDKPILLMLDNDEVGKQGIYGKKLSGKRRKAGALEMLSKLTEVCVARWPAGCSDFPDLSKRKLHRIIDEMWRFID